MSPVALLLLRRIAVATLLLAVVLGAGSRILRELGMIGPGAEEQVAQAAAALEAARQYGAPASLAPYQRAQEGLAAARLALARGDLRLARRTAAAAQEQAIAAQRLALVRREDLRHEAEQVADDLGDRMDGLEALYDEVSPGLSRGEVAALISQMKKVRERGASVVLAYEQGRFEKVLEDAPAARESLDAMRAELASHRR